MTKQPSRAELWAQFASAAFQHGDMFGREAAMIADAMMNRFDERFEWYDGGYGTFWKQKPPPPPPNRKVKR